MAEDVPQKRVLPPRERRESAAKRRASSPMAPAKTTTPKRPTPTKSTHKPAPPARATRKKGQESTPVPREVSAPVPETVLPTKTTDNEPLPTLRTKQPTDLSLTDYQSIAESAVLAMSVHQSRAKWLLDDMFKKYWTKPSKKKGTPEVQNPSTKSMVRLGPCTMLVEPHSFEVMMYTVRDPNVPVTHPRQPAHFSQTQMYPHYPGYANTPTPGPPLQARPPYPPPMSAQNTPIKQENRRMSATPIASPSQPAKGNVQVVIPSKNVAGPASSPHSGPAPPPQNSPAATVPPPESEKNPVIQKLATAAASDPELKTLMKVVASSKASPEQLKIFQSHIDRLNTVIARENAEAEKSKLSGIQGPNPVQTNHPQPLTTSPGPVQTTPAKTGLAPPVTLASPAPSVPPQSIPTSSPYRPPIPTVASQAPSAYTGPPPPQHHRQPPPASKAGSLGTPIYSHPNYTPPLPPPPPPQPLVKHVVFENLTPISSTQSGSSDRYFFPDYAVLDFSPDPRGTVILVSFFVIKKGSQVNANVNSSSNVKTGSNTSPKHESKYKPDEEYFQPVTMRLVASNPKVLETIARAAKPLSVVQEHMENVIKTKKPSELCFLPLRLPKEASGTGDGVLGEEETNTTTVATKDVEDKVNGQGGAEFGIAGEVEMEVDDELKDIYGDPDSIAPLGWFTGT